MRLNNLSHYISSPGRRDCKTQKSSTVTQASDPCLSALIAVFRLSALGLNLKKWFYIKYTCLMLSYWARLY